MTPDAASAIAFAVLICVLITAGITDVRTGKIFNWLTYPAILFGLAYWTALGLLRDQPPGFAQAMIGFLAAAVPFVVIVLGGGLGFGDAKLMAAVGAWLAMPGALIALLAVLIAGGVLALGTMAWQRSYRNVWGNFLWILVSLKTAAAGRGAARRDYVLPTAESIHAMPYGVAIFVGCAAAGGVLLI